MDQDGQATVLPPCFAIAVYLVVCQRGSTPLPLIAREDLKAFAPGCARSDRSFLKPPLNRNVSADEHEVITFVITYQFELRIKLATCCATV